MGRFMTFWVGLLLGGLPAVAPAFEQVEAETFAGSDFVFPDDIRGPGTHILFLGIASDQENGEYQGEELIRWHRDLEAAGVLPDHATAWHLPVIDGAPFFIKGVIRRGLAKNYVDVIPSQQGAAIFVSDYESFADAAGVQADGRPTVMLYQPATGVQAVYRGETSPAAVAEIRARLVPAAPADVASEQSAERAEEVSSD